VDRACEALRVWTPQTAAALDAKAESILAQLHVMIRDADRWCL